jgi:hypothetical protein
VADLFLFYFSKPTSPYHSHVEESQKKRQNQHNVGDHIAGVCPFRTFMFDSTLPFKWPATDTKCTYLLASIFIQHLNLNICFEQGRFFQPENI